MIGILGGMGTQAGLDFCSKLAKLNRGKADQKYPLFVLYNKSNIPDRKQNLKKYNKVLKSLIDGCKFLQKSKCKFISIPCNTAHYWYKDLRKKIKIPILNMPEIVYLNAKNNLQRGVHLNKAIEVQSKNKSELESFDKILTAINNRQDIHTGLNKSHKLEMCSQSGNFGNHIANSSGGPFDKEVVDVAFREVDNDE